MTAYTNCCGDVISFQFDVVAYFEKQRQLRSRDLESGGQLFGVVNICGVVITAASGPYSNDMRSSRRYRSNPVQAQEEIERRAKGGLLYLGEWHTHYQRRPRPSIDDVAAITALATSSVLNMRHLILLIVGNGSCSERHCIESCSKNEVIKWEIAEFSLTASSGSTKQDR